MKKAKSKPEVPIFVNFYKIGTSGLDFDFFAIFCDFSRCPAQKIWPAAEKRGLSADFQFEMRFMIVFSERIAKISCWTHAGRSRNAILAQKIHAGFMLDAQGTRFFDEFFAKKFMLDTNKNY